MVRKVVETTSDGRLVMDLRYEDIEMFNITPERIRELSKDNLISSGPGLDERWMPTSD